MKTTTVILVFLASFSIAAEGPKITLSKENIPDAFKGKKYDLNAKCGDLRKHFKGKKQEEKQNYKWSHSGEAIEDAYVRSDFTTAFGTAVTNGKAKNGAEGEVICSAKKCSCSNGICSFKLKK